MSPSKSIFVGLSRLKTFLQLIEASNRHPSNEHKASRGEYRNHSQQEAQSEPHQTEQKVT